MGPMMTNAESQMAETVQAGPVLTDGPYMVYQCKAERREVAAHPQLHRRVARREVATNAAISACPAAFRSFADALTCPGA